MLTACLCSQVLSALIKLEEKMKCAKGVSHVEIERVKREKVARVIALKREHEKR